MSDTVCLENRTRHFFKGGPECLYCHAPNPYTSGASAPNEQPTFPLEGFAALQQEAQPQAQLEPQPQTRRPRKPSPEDQQRLKRQRENIAKLIAQLPHRAQASIASVLYSYHGDAFDLSAEQQQSLGAAWLQVLDAFSYDPTSPWVAVAVLAATEVEISMGQWRAMYQDVEIGTANLKEK